MGEANILSSIKKLLGVYEDDHDFDEDLKMHINSALMILNQIGIGPEAPYQLTTGDETWSGFLGDDLSYVEAVKTYIYMKVKLVWDSSTMSSAVIQIMKEQCQEYEWRLRAQIELKNSQQEA